MQEKSVSGVSGLIAVFIQLFMVGFIVYNVSRIVKLWDVSDWTDFIIPVISFTVFVIIFSGYTTVAPNECIVFQLLGKYKGTLSDNGFWFINPFYGSFNISLKTENYQTPTLTVNEGGGVPIEIAAIISYKVKDTYKHQYAVEDAEVYVKNQFEISLRSYAKAHTYNELSTDEHEFVEDLTAKVEKAGVEVLEAKITHLSYAAEIASAMLQKQQAQAMSEAKQTIVENAVSIAKHATESINGEMLPSDKSKFIANLIVVLCSDKGVLPVVNVE